jgi:hypothetical protein
MEGQITITDFSATKIEKRNVDDFTAFLNKQGESQYKQIGRIVVDTYERHKDDETSVLLDRITNNVSVFVLEQSMNYSKYLRNQAK